MFSLKKLLYVTDLSEEHLTLDSLNHILPIEKLGLEKILFLQTTPFDKWQSQLSNHNVKSEVMVNKKVKHTDITTIANKFNADFVVVNMTKQSRDFMSKKIIHKTDFPVLFISPERYTLNKPIFSHVVFATDWSEGSERALHFLLKFKEFLGETEIVNVINKKLTIKDMRELKERIARTRKVCLNENIDAEAHIYAGNISDEILLAAKDYKSTIIVLGTSSRKKNFMKIFKKSSTKIVTEKSYLPVLVIP